MAQGVFGWLLCRDRGSGLLKSNVSFHLLIRMGMGFVDWQRARRPYTICGRSAHRFPSPAGGRGEYLVVVSHPQEKGLRFVVFRKRAKEIVWCFPPVRNENVCALSPMGG